MQFFGLTTVALFVATLAPSVLACDPATQDCCYGGSDGGLAGCENQRDVKQFKEGGRWVRICAQPEFVAQYCSNNGVTFSQCTADCCSVSKKIGIACP